MRKKLQLWLFIILPLLSNGQSEYLVGTSNESIEPDQSLISLHLAGYGAPREGRFTLQWVNIGEVPEAKAMTGLGGRLYIVSKGRLQWTDVTDNSVWHYAAKAENINAITGIDGILYAADDQGGLLKAKLKHGLKWGNAGSADQPVIALASNDGNLFAASTTGAVWRADISGVNIRLVSYDSLPGIKSLAAAAGQLYALTRDGVLYKHETKNPKARWLKIACRNGQTITENIQHIAISGGRIYGINDENQLFRGEHRSEGNLSVRAMAVKSNDKTAVIVTLDVCGLNDGFTGLVKHQIYEQNNLPASAVLINSSHTHFAPVTQNWLTWQEANQRPDSAYLYTTIRKGILKAVDRAIKSMSPAELTFGRGLTDIGYNRSLKNHPECYDNSVDVVKVNYLNKKDPQYLFLASCHPVFSTAGKLHYTISANYPGVARRLTEERTGASNTLFVQGTAGDINPKDNGEYITGEKLSNEVIAVINRPMSKISGPVSCYLDTINLPVTPWSPEKISAFRVQNSNKPGDILAEKNVRWCDLMTKYHQEGTMPQSMPVYVQTFNIGNWKLVGFSRETTSSYGLDVKKLWPGKLISVAGYTNDVSCYLPTNLHIEQENYEGKESFFWYGMPCIFPLDVEKIILTSIKSLER